MASSRTRPPSAPPARPGLLVAASAVLAAIASVLLSTATAAAFQASIAAPIGTAPIVTAPTPDGGPPAPTTARSARPGSGIDGPDVSRPPAAQPCPLPATTRLVSAPPPGGPTDWLLSADQAALGSARDPQTRHTADAHRRRSLGLRAPGSTGGTRPSQGTPRPDPAAVLRIPGRDPPSPA